MSIEFVHYSGSLDYRARWCEGNLVLKIDGETVVFGPENRFWLHNGSCLIKDKLYFANDIGGEPMIDRYRWPFDEEKIPPQYRKYADEIRYIFEKNVPFGICGNLIIRCNDEPQE